MTMRFTTKELAIITVLAAEQAAGNRVVSLSTIVVGTSDIVDPDEKQRNFRGGIGATLRNLQRKVGVLGLSIVPNGEVGRGNKAHFRLVGDFQQAAKKIEELLMAEFKVKYAVVGELGSVTETVEAVGPEEAATKVRKAHKEIGQNISVSTVKKVRPAKYAESA